MIDNSINIHKTNKHLLIEHTKTMAYDVGNPVSGLGQAQKCGWVKPVNGIPNLHPLNNWISNTGGTNTDL
jgi:hypothetical protein